MTPAPWHELGDPMFDAIAAEEHADHAKAKARGERLRALSEAIVSGLVARGILPGGQSAAARILVFGLLVDSEHGAVAVDIPDMRGEEDGA